MTLAVRELDLELRTIERRIASSLRLMGFTPNEAAAAADEAVAGWGVSATVELAVLTFCNCPVGRINIECSIHGQ